MRVAAEIVLLVADSWQNRDIAAELGVGPMQVSRWRNRYAESGLVGIERNQPCDASQVKIDVVQLVELTTQDKPDAVTHWGTRKMTAKLGVSAASVSRHWRANGLKRHLFEIFKVSSAIMKKSFMRLVLVMLAYLQIQIHIVSRCARR